MDFGVGYHPTHDGINPGALAQLLEERRQDAVFFAEHTHMPASREGSGPEGFKGMPLQRRYWHCYVLFVALMAAVAATTKLRVGSGVCLIVERDPIITANEVASVDHLSGGRFEFGVGAGWHRREMRNHGTDPQRRMTVLWERVEAMKANAWSGPGCGGPLSGCRPDLPPRRAGSRSAGERHRSVHRRMTGG